MELRYSTTRRDIARAYWRSLRRNRRHQLLWLLCVGFAFLNGVLRGARTVLFGLELSVVMIAVLALVPLVIYKKQQRVLRVGAEGIETTIGTRAGALSWRDVASVEREGDRIIITRRNLNVYIVPTTAFPSMTAPDDAVAQWKVWQRAASKPG